MPGDTTERGYGSDHQKVRAQWAPIVESGEAWCAEVVCLEPSRWIRPGTPWDLAHSRDRTAYLGPAHARCNRSEGSRRGNRLRRGLPKRTPQPNTTWRTSRQWLPGTPTPPRVYPHSATRPLHGRSPGRPPHTQPRTRQATATWRSDDAGSASEQANEEASKRASVRRREEATSTAAPASHSTTGQRTGQADRGGIATGAPRALTHRNQTHFFPRSVSR